MATIYGIKDQESLELVRRITEGVYLDGQCYEFAIALHRGLGWPIVGVMERHIVRHALVQTSWDTYWDARGEVTPREVGKPFGINLPRIDTFTESSLLASVRKVDERSIYLARKAAERAWPDLPWINSRKTRALRFAEALEDLCREHGIWIRAPFDTARPLLAEHDLKDKLCYELALTDDGLAYMFDRKILSLVD